MKLSLKMVVAALAVSLGTNFASAAGGNRPTLTLPIRIHVFTDLSMTRELNGSSKKMGSYVSDRSVRAMMTQVNQIWRPAGVHWEMDTAKGGGGVSFEKAGGGQRKDVATLAKTAAARSRTNEVGLDPFRKLADPARNDTLSDSGRRNRATAKMYHLYLFPFVGSTLQGTAELGGTFAIVGLYSDKHTRGRKLPQARPHNLRKLSAAYVTKEGSLSMTIAHELGHNLGLTHEIRGKNTNNLMKGHAKLQLAAWQIDKARATAKTFLSRLSKP